jgi:hypothetical protein
MKSPALQASARRLLSHVSNQYRVRPPKNKLERAAALAVAPPAPAQQQHAAAAAAAAVPPGAAGAPPAPLPMPLMASQMAKEPAKKRVGASVHT